MKSGCPATTPTCHTCRPLAGLPNLPHQARTSRCLWHPQPLDWERGHCCHSIGNGAVSSAPITADPRLGRAVTVADEAQKPLRLFDSIPEAVADIAAGNLVVVLDNEDRENEGDLIMTGEHVTQQAMAFMVEHTTGIICTAMPPADLDRLQLPLMVPTQENDEAMRTAFTVTVDARETTSTGVSASDRCNTIRALSDPATLPEGLNRPGHIFPLRARPGGVRVRPGHTEAAVDLCLLAGCRPVGVLSEIVDRQTGQMARTPQLLEFARVHGLKCITVADLVRYLNASDIRLSS